jgi:hypothetical protein
MNIGFYGTTAACASNTSFINIIKQELETNIISTGVLNGSEERILFEIKRAKHVDVAVIFHSTWKHVFVANCAADKFVEEDLSSLEFEMLNNRFYSTLMHIDAYLVAKQIFTIHVADPRYIPKWFRFQSGRNHGGILKIMQEQYREDATNNISDSGNKQIAHKLVQAIREHNFLEDVEDRKNKSVKVKCSNPSNNNPSILLTNGETSCQN